MRALCKEAAMAPIRDAGTRVATVAASALRPVQRRDFEAALQVVRPAVSPVQLAALEAWTRDFGMRA